MANQGHGSLEHQQYNVFGVRCYTVVAAKVNKDLHDP